MRFPYLIAISLLVAPLAPLCATAQLNPLSHPASSNNPLTQPTLSPGTLELIQLDVEFAKDVLHGGGKAFASWFADDAMTLNNGKAPTFGKTRIAADANWDPKQYTLQWQPLGAQMGPSGDMGWTYGHYDGISKDNNGNEIKTSGRYITVWKKVNGKWKVSLDASADEPPAAGDCCKLNKP